MRCFAFLPVSHLTHRHTPLGLTSTGGNVRVCMGLHMPTHVCVYLLYVRASPTCENVHARSGGSGYLSSAQEINWWVIKQLALELSKIMNEGPVDVNI